MSADRRTLSLPPSVQLDTSGTLPRLAVASTIHGAAEIYLHGAHLTQWQPSGQRPVIWLSSKSAFDPARAIRGGVPICFPWFGPHASDRDAPMHGFARIQPWLLSSAGESPEAVTLTFTLAGTDASRASVWPHAFEATYQVTIGAALSLSLRIRNRGRTAFSFEEALHSYFVVGDVRAIAIAGLEGGDYLDKTAAFARKAQGGDAVRFSSETDRIYLDTTATCVIDDPGMRRRITIAKTGSRTTVVWNPWVARAQAIPDFGDDEWPGMVCVETCNVGDAAVHLEPGDVHVMTATIQVS